MIKKLLFIPLLIAVATVSFAQSNNATLRGTILNQHGKPLDMVNIGLKDYPLGTSSNREGKFLLRVPAGRDVVIVFSSLGYTTVSDTINILPEDNLILEITLDRKSVV